MVAIIAAYFAWFIPSVFPRPTLITLDLSHDLVADLGYQVIKDNMS